MCVLGQVYRRFFTEFIHGVSQFSVKGEKEKKLRCKYAEMCAQCVSVCVDITLYVFVCAGVCVCVCAFVYRGREPTNQ